MSATMNWQRNREVTERWIIEGQLELVTPTSLSNGDDDPLVDLPVVVDPLDGVALLTGASLAGALRSYLADFDPAYAVGLFGGARGHENRAQSPLIVEDALGDLPIIELRDGVSIDPTTRTAKDKEKYDRQLLSAGMRFDIGFELVIPRGDDTQLKAALAQALYGLQEGDIRLGGRKRRGYGQCRVTSWRAWRYDLEKPEGLKGWLAHGRAGLDPNQAAPWSWSRDNQGDGILDWAELAGVQRPSRKPDLLRIKATFGINDSVLIRSGFEAETGPDAVHLRSARPGSKEPVPVMSGTSLAGVIRAQALRIARTVAGPGQSDIATDLVDGLFGVMQQQKRASRVTVDECVIEGQKDIVQTRVKIDRFTGGAFESALFAEQPAFGGAFTLGLALRPPQKLIDPEPKAMTDEEKVKYKEEVEALRAEHNAGIGLLLLVLKDLWTGFTPVGGSSSVGRGRLTGQSATIILGGKSWELKATKDGLEIITGGDAQAADLNEFVSGLSAHFKAGGGNGHQ